MARKTYTEEEKQAILKRAAETSALAASKEMGVSRAAIMKWQKEAAGAEAPVEKKPRGRKKAAEKAADAPAEKKPRGRKKVEKAAEENMKPVVQFFVQSPFGHEITPDAIRDKVGEVDTIYIRVDQNKIYWVKGEETGAVDIW